MDPRKLYDALGVPEDATDAEIKRAYRQLSHQYHPDKPDGDEEKFRAIAYAYRVLKDPGSRLLYTKTGRTERPKIEIEVRDILFNAFQQALIAEAPLVLDFARKFIVEGEKILSAKKQKLIALRKRLKKKARRIKTKDGENLFQMLVDKELEGCEANMADIEWQLKVGKKCHEALDKYESTEEKPEPVFKPHELSLGKIFEDSLRKSILENNYGMFGFKDEEKDK